MKNVGSERPTNSKEFTENYSVMAKVIEKVDRLAKRLLAGGSENSKARHVKRGKMLPRDRVANLLDTGSFFLEVGLIIGFASAFLRSSPVTGVSFCASGTSGEDPLLSPFSSLSFLFSGLNIEDLRLVDE